MEFFTAIPPEPVNSLGLAIVQSSSTPLLLLDAKLVVRAASATFCHAFGLDPDTVTGREIFALGDGQWDILQLRSLLMATVSNNAAIDAYELNLKSGAGIRHLVLNARRLDYGDTGDVRLILAVSDVTAARLAELEKNDLVRQKSDLVREKTVLLQELQHRVANSLQIIASVLLQSARKVQSVEARTHLEDAHHRVMSIATLQKQLAITSTEDIPLRPYFTDLCNSIGASMIADPRRLKITPTIDDTVTTADVSVCLGLIVTELVINALKHAYPKKVKMGEISVHYASDGPAWLLTVGDDGVGVPGEDAKSTPGLGTGIVEALSKQLRASFETRDAHPGTLVSIIHDGTPAQ